MFTCISCLADTDNDDDMCDECADYESKGNKPCFEELLWQMSIDESRGHYYIPSDEDLDGLDTDGDH